MTKAKKKQRQDNDHLSEARLRGTIYALVLCSIMLAISFVIYITIEADILRELDEVQFEALVNMENEIHFTMEDATTYVHHIAFMPQTKRVFSQNDVALSDSQISFKEVVEYTEFIDKLRLIGLDGQEIISVSEQEDGHAIIKADVDLQNKAASSYFKSALNVNEGIIYIGDLELEMEGDRVKRPYKPVIRIATGIYENEKKLGLIVLSYKAKALYKMVGAHLTHNEDDWYLIDENGYYLKGPSNEVEYGSIIKDRRGFGFFADNPDAWSQMILWNEGKIQVNGGWLYYKKVCPIDQGLSVDTCKDWFITLNVPQASIKEEVSRIVLGLQIGNIVLIPLLAGLGWSLGNYQIRNRHYRKKLENQARIDPLTGLYNRRFINEMLDQHIQMAKRRKEDLSIIYVDLNNLKTVNDEYGHEIGDIMIKEAAQAMKDNIRKTDEIARLGGDEFMIVLPDCSTEQINSIMARVIEIFEKAGMHHVNLPWTLSWGASSWLGGEDSIQALINRADKAMYENKKTFKDGQTRQG